MTYDPRDDEDEYGPWDCDDFEPKDDYWYWIFDPEEEPEDEGLIDEG